MLQQFLKLDSLKTPNNSWIGFIAMSMCTFLFCDNLLTVYCLSTSSSYPGVQDREFMFMQMSQGWALRNDRRGASYCWGSYSCCYCLCRHLPWLSPSPGFPHRVPWHPGLPSACIAAWYTPFLLVSILHCHVVQFSSRLHWKKPPYSAIKLLIILRK